MYLFMYLFIYQDVIQEVVRLSDYSLFYCILFLSIP